MTTSKSICEIRLHNAMIRNNLTLEECINAIDTYAMDKKFHDDLDSLYNVEQDTWDDNSPVFQKIRCTHAREWALCNST